MYGWILFIVAVASILTGGPLFSIVLCVGALLAAEEFLAMTRAKGMRPSQRIMRSMIIAFFVLAAVSQLPGLKLPWNFAVEHFPLVLTVGVCASFFRLLFRSEAPPATIADIATTILGFIYLGWMPSHLVLLRNLYPPGVDRTLGHFQHPGLAYVWATLFIIWATDVFAYYVGKKFGKHLLYPQISPKKTVEGAIGGLLFSVLMATLVIYASDNYLFPSHPFGMRLWHAPLMGVVLSVAAQLGDLCESLLKRDAGIKDSGTAIPGHGGVLDRGDSLIFASAISYYWVCIVVLGLL